MGMISEDIREPFWLKGQEVAAALKEKLFARSRLFQKQARRRAKLVVVRVGSDPASCVYVSHKRRMAEVLEIHCHEYTLDENTSFQEIEGILRRSNAAKEVDGIIVQLPLPHKQRPDSLLELIDPSKDVDGLHPLNRGRLYGGESSGFIPCTPWGCLALLQHYGFDPCGATAVVVGRSLLVGKPLGALLLKENATVIFAHSFTRNLSQITRLADFLFVASGKPGLIGEAHVKRGAVVLDIGIHRMGDQITGNVDSKTVFPKVKALSPVPGGVGPLTVMGLMYNTLRASFQRCGLPFSSIVS